MDLDPKRIPVGPDADVSDIDLETETFRLARDERPINARADELLRRRSAG